MKTPDKQKSITWNIVTGAQAFGCSRDRLTAALKEAGVAVGPGETYTTKKIHHALLGGDFRLESMLLKRARRKREELELKRMERELIPTEEVASFIIGTFAPLREFVVQMPGQLAALVNPSDPANARAHLDRWRDEFLKLKEKVPVKE